MLVVVYAVISEKEKRASSMTVWDVLCAFGSGLLQKKLKTPKKPKNVKNMFKT